MSAGRVAALLFALAAAGAGAAPGGGKYSGAAAEKGGKVGKEPKKKEKEVGVNEFWEALKKADPELSKKSPKELEEFLEKLEGDDFVKFKEKMDPDTWGRMANAGEKEREERLMKQRVRSDTKAAQFPLYKATSLAKELVGALKTEGISEDIEVAVAVLPEKKADGVDEAAVKARLEAVIPVFEKHTKDVIAKYGFTKLSETVNALLATEKRTTDRAFSENMAVVQEIVTGRQRPSRAGRHLRLDDIAAGFVAMGAADRAAAIAKVELLKEEVLAGVTVDGFGLTVETTDMYLETMRRIVKKDTYAEDALLDSLEEMQSSEAAQDARGDSAPADPGNAPTGLTRRQHVLSAFISDDERLTEARRRRAPKVETVGPEEGEEKEEGQQQKTLLVRRNPDGKLGFRFKGTTVTSVQKDWAEQRAGMKSGMVIVRFNDVPIRTEEDLINVKVPRGSAGQYPVVVNVPSRKHASLLSSTDAEVRKMPVKKLQKLLRAAGIPAQDIGSDPIRLVQEAVRVAREHREEKDEL